MKNALGAIIIAECANHRGGHCIVRSVRGQNHNGLCLILEESKPCRYFEASVLPLARLHPERWPEVADQYGLLAPGAKGIASATIRRCGCGEPLPPRRRLCDACAAKNRRAAYRRAKSGGSAADIPQLSQKTMQKLPKIGG